MDIIYTSHGHPYFLSSVPTGQRAYAAHTTANASFLISRSGAIERTYPCITCHGSAMYTNKVRASTSASASCIIVLCLHKYHL